MHLHNIVFMKYFYILYIHSIYTDICIHSIHKLPSHCSSSKFSYIRQHPSPKSLNNRKIINNNNIKCMQYFLCVLNKDYQEKRQLHTYSVPRNTIKLLNVYLPKQLQLSWQKQIPLPRLEPNVGHMGQVNMSDFVHPKFTLVFCGIF